MCAISETISKRKLFRYLCKKGRVIAMRMSMSNVIGVFLESNSSYLKLIVNYT